MLLYLFIIFGGVGLLAALISFANMAKASGRAFRWWHWLMASISVVLCVTSFAWLGTQMGEGVPRGGWYGFGFIIVLSLIFGLLTWRLLPSKQVAST